MDRHLEIDHACTIHARGSHEALLPPLRRGRNQVHELASTDFQRRMDLQVSDLYPVSAPLPGILPGRRRHPRLPQHRSRHRKAAGGKARRTGHAVAGICLAPSDRGQPLPGDHGPRLSGSLPGQLQPEYDRRLCRHQLGRTGARQLRDREGPWLCQAGEGNREEGRHHRRWSRRPRLRLPITPTRAFLHPFRIQSQARRHADLRPARLSHAT